MMVLQYSTQVVNKSKTEYWLQVTLISCFYLLFQGLFGGLDPRKVCRFRHGALGTPEAEEGEDLSLYSLYLPQDVNVCLLLNLVFPLSIIISIMIVWQHTVIIQRAVPNKSLPVMWQSTVQMKVRNHSSSPHQTLRNRIINSNRLGIAELPLSS